MIELLLMIATFQWLLRNINATVRKGFPNGSLECSDSILLRNALHQITHGVQFLYARRLYQSLRETALSVFQFDKVVFEVFGMKQRFHLFRVAAVSKECVHHFAA